MTQLQKAIIILAGLPFSGKTTLGRKLSKIYDIPFLDIDDTRHEINPSSNWHGPEKEQEIMMSAYIRNHDKAAKVLASGSAVILSATYSREKYHEMLRELANKEQVDFRVFLLEIPDALAPIRLQERLHQASSSNIVTIESYNEVKDRYKPFEGEELIRVDTSQGLEATLDLIAKYLAFAAR